MILCIPLGQISTLETLVQIRELSFTSSAFLCCYCLLASAKISIRFPPCFLSGTKAHKRRIKALFRHQKELMHKFNAGIVY